jgi:hypothetical protein
MVGDGSNADAKIGPLCLGVKEGAQRIRHIALKTMEGIKRSSSRWKKERWPAKSFHELETCVSIVEGAAERRDAVWLALIHIRHV